MSAGSTFGEWTSFGHLDVMRGLGQPHILKTDRAVFETLLLDIAESCEEWLTSATSMGLAERTGDVRVLPWERAHPTPGRGQVAFAYGSPAAGRAHVKTAPARIPRGRSMNGV